VVLEAVMVNNIKLTTGEHFLFEQRKGRYTIFSFENNIEKTSGQLTNDKILIQCNGNKEWFLRPFRAVFKNTLWYSGKYHATEHNSFLGKHHSEKMKKDSSERMQGKYIGENNPFYGKHHSVETKNFLSEINIGKQAGKNNPFYGKKHPPELMLQIVESGRNTKTNWTNEQKQEYSKNHSIAQQNRYLIDPQKYISNKRKAGLISVNSQMRFKMNKLENKVAEKLMDMGLDEFIYSVILNYMQFDFGCKNKKILIEVNGSYWHGDPRIYHSDKLNLTQQIIKEKDINKLKWAQEHELVMFTIWEKDINENNWSILDEVKKCYNQLN
jgi:very-short-patch-repair endonuclease